VGEEGRRGAVVFLGGGGRFVRRDAIFLCIASSPIAASRTIALLSGYRLEDDSAAIRAFSPIRRGCGRVERAADREGHPL